MQNFCDALLSRSKCNLPHISTGANKQEYLSGLTNSSDIRKAESNVETPDIQDWLREARAGNRDALEKLLEKHRPLVAAIARKYTDCWEDREDLTQEVMKAAYRGFESLRDDMAFVRWIMGIAENIGKNWLNRERPKQRATDSLDSPPYQEGGSAQQAEAEAGPERRIVARQTHDYLLQVLHQNCSGAEYNVMIKRWNGYDYSQIAHDLSIKPETARSHYHRGERKLWTSLLTDHRDFLGGETEVAGAFVKAANSGDPERRLTEEEKQAFQAGERRKDAFQSACMKLRTFLPTPICVLLFVWSLLHGQR